MSLGILYAVLFKMIFIDIHIKIPLRYLLISCHSVPMWRLQVKGLN